jgi:alkylhydroperoxidase/carboxymuconolactone decarboxylase family protein YurZ
MPDPLETIRKIDPAFTKNFEAADAFAFSDGALSKKIKLLMAMAFDAVNGAANGVAALARSAMQEGATKEEIAETIRVAVNLGGVGAAYIASEGLKGIVA